MEDGRVIESVKRERKNLLKERKVEYFSHAENFSESPEISETAGKYIMRCERLKDFQLGFLKKPKIIYLEFCLITPENLKTIQRQFCPKGESALPIRMSEMKPEKTRIPHPNCRRSAK